MWRTKLILTVLTLATLNAPGLDRYVTLTARWSETTVLEIPVGDVAELVSFPAVFNRSREVAVFREDTLLARISSSFPGDGGGGGAFPLNPFIVAGPARFVLKGVGNETFPPIFCTVRVFSESYTPTGTMVIPPGAGGGTVGLECSPDLVAWSAATNGIYTNHPTAKFFRLNLDRIFPGQPTVALGLRTNPPKLLSGTGATDITIQKRFLTWVPDSVPGGGKLDIPAGQAVRVASVLSAGSRFHFEKNGIKFMAGDLVQNTSVKADPVIIAGPAQLDGSASPSLTLEFIPSAADPQTTLVVPPGAAGGRVQLQLSTNLRDWASAEPGTYTNLTAASFFRISLERHHN